MTTRTRLATAFIAMILCASVTIAQTTTFTYQGKLNDTSVAANGPYDFTFKLYDASSGGSQIGSNVVVNDANVIAGIFTVNLDFGAAAFTSGAPRFLQIEIRPGASSGAFTSLTPRQAITSPPYSIKSLTSDSATTATNSTQLGGVAASQFVVTTDPRMTDPRSPTAGSANYIQNTTTTQATSNFNISGNGVVGGSLGIGTNNPSGLQVVSPVSETARAVSNVRFGISGGTARAIFEDAAAATQWEIDNSAGRFRIFSPGAERFTINSIGNVGIGTSSPNARFSIGDIGPTWTTAFWGASMNMPNGSALGWEVNSSGQRYGIGQSTGGLYFFRTTNPFGTNITPPNYTMTLTDGGSVGIGTSTPLSTLHVNGGIRGDSLSSPSDLFLNSNGGGRIAFRTTSTAERMTILDNGNVGIGTTNPTAKLEIPGLLKVNSDGVVQVSILDASTFSHVCYNNGGIPGLFAGLVTCGSSAEYVPSIDGGSGLPEAADLVSIAPSKANPYDDTHGPFTVERSATACDANLLGFIADPEKGANGKKLNDKYLPLAIYGYFPAKVTTENGPIKRGDPITSSSKAGYGMKSTEACKIIGYALEDSDQEGTIQVFANTSEYTAPLVADLKSQIERLRQEKKAEVETLKARLDALEKAMLSGKKKKK